MLVAVALLRGAIIGAVGGFFAGLLVDTATLGTLGLTSLVLTIAGYWIGRYGETTGRDRGHAPFMSVAVISVLYAFGVLLVHFVLGERAPAGRDRARARPGDRHEPDPHRARVRARAASPAPARPLRLRNRGAAPWLARPCRARRRAGRRRATSRPSSRTASRRSSRCASPFSAASCSRSSRRSSFASGRCRCSPGQKYVDQAQANSFRTLPRAGAARSDPRPQRRAARHERAGDGDPALAVRPAEGLHDGTPSSRGSHGSPGCRCTRSCAASRSEGERRPRSPRSSSASRRAT